MKISKSGKDSRQLERHLKGVSNHWRIEILNLISKNEGITLYQISQSLEGNIKTISEHTKKLSQAGLVSKKYRGRNVIHSLTPYGRRIYKFIETF